LITTLYEHPNITRTAEILFTTQPTVSKRLLQIEEEFGVQIVIRGPKGVSFTPEGEFIALEGSKLIQHMKSIKENVQKISNGHSGWIRLGITNSMGRYILPPLLNRYKELLPRVDFNMSTDISGSIISMVEKQKVHIGFIRGGAETEMEKHLLSISQAYLVSKDKISLRDLPSLNQIQYISDAFSKRSIAQWWRNQFTDPPHIGMQVNHGDTCREMISSGLGYGIFLSPEFIEGDTRLYQLPLHFRDGTPFVRKNWMIWHKESWNIPLIRNFIEFIKAEFQEIK